MLKQFISILAISLIFGNAQAVDLHDPASILSGTVMRDTTSEKYCTPVNSRLLGNACYMTYSKAIDYCASQAKRLLTAKEFAQLSSQLGSKGILEEKEYQQKKNAGENVTSYYRIRVQNTDDLIEVFYYSYAGYIRPAGELGKNWIWSSSDLAIHSGRGIKFSAYDGRIDFNEYPSNPATVICVSGI